MLSLLSLSVLVVIAAFYLALSWFPLHDLQSPYRTPLSSALWYIKQAVRPLNFTNVEGWTVVVDSGSLSRGREEYATATIDGTQERDLASLSWALSSLIDRGDCEPFIEGIAGFMRSEKIVGAPVIMHELVKRKDLARHILELLVNCVEPAHDSIDVRRRQSISGLGALRALTSNWFSDDAGVTLQDDDPHGVWKWSYSFPEKVIDVTMSLRSVSDSVVSMHARCTAAVAVWRLLVDYDELGAYTKQKLVTVERLLAYLESTRDKRRRSGRRTRVRDKLKELINHDLLAVWAQSTQMHIETLRMNSPQPDSKRAQIQNWDTEKADLKMMRYLWEQNMCPPEAWLYDDIELQHNEIANGESSMLDSVLAYLSLHAKLLHRTLKPLETTQLPLSAYVDEATECLDHWSSATMKELMPRIIASGHVANVIQLIKHAIKGPRRSDVDQIMILETLETITVPIRALQGKLNERSQRSLLGLLRFLKEQHLDVMFRDIDNLSGSVYQFIVKIGEKVIPLAVRGLGAPNLWQPAQSILFEYEDTCPDLADTLSDAQTWIRGKLLHHQLSTAQSYRKPLLLLAPPEPLSSPAVATIHPRLPLSKPAVPSPDQIGPASPQNSTARALEMDLYQFVPSDCGRNAHKIIRPLYSPSGRLQEHYIDVPVEPEQGEFIDTAQHPWEPAGTIRRERDSMGSWASGRPRDVAPSPTARPPSPQSSSRRGSVRSLPAQKSHDGAPTSSGQRPSPPSSDGRGREGWWTARGFYDDPPTSHVWAPSFPSSSAPLGAWRSRAKWQHAPTSTRPPSPPSPNKYGSVGSWATWKPHDSAPTSPTRPPSPPSPNRHDGTGSSAAQKPHEGAATPTHPPSPSSSSSPNSSVVGGSVLAARLEPFAPPMQASTSLQTAITAEMEPAQDTTKYPASLPVVVVQIREGEGSRSHLHSSRASSPNSPEPEPAIVPPAPRRGLFAPRSPQSSLPSAPLPERGRSSSPPKSGWRSRPPAPFPTMARHGLGLYMQSHSGPLPLSAPGTRFHTPVDEGTEPGVSTQVYPLSPTAPALAPASAPTSSASTFGASPPSGSLASIPPQSRWADRQEHLAERVLPSAGGPFSRASESGNDVAVGNGDAGRSWGEVEFGSKADVDGVVEAAGGEVDGRTRDASGGSNDGSGESKRASRSADELQQNNGSAGVEIDKLPPSLHESRARPSTPNQRPLHVIQNVDVDADDAHSPN